MEEVTIIISMLHMKVVKVTCLLLFEIWNLFDVDFDVEIWNLFDVDLIFLT